MNTEKIQELITNSDLPQIKKQVSIGFISRAEKAYEKSVADKDLIIKIGNVNTYFETILSTDEVKIYKVSGKDEWDIKYPFRSIYLDKNGNWKRVATVAPTLDTAFIAYLENKYLGENSGFSDFALKMLEIKID